MNTLMLADGTVMKLYTDENLISVQHEGTYVKGIELAIADSNLDTIKDVFNDKTKVSSFSVISKTKSFSRSFNGYQVLKQIALDTELTNEYGSDIFKVKMAMTSDVKELINTWTKQLESASEKVSSLQESVDSAKKSSDDALSNVSELKENFAETIKSTDAKVEDVSNAVNEVKASLLPKSFDSMTLEEAIATRVTETKYALADFLEAHPIYSTCHSSNGTEGDYYSVTSDKQQYLLSMIAIAEAAKEAGVEYSPSWNATGKACTYDWTIEQLKQLALEIGNYVRPMVSKQQKMESELKVLTSIDAVKAYNISFE